jgi:IS5 family transposase
VTDFESALLQAPQQESIQAREAASAARHAGGRLDDLVETAKAHIRAKVEHPFRVIKRQFGFQKTRLRGMVKNRCKVNVLAALSNLFMARHQLLCRT